MSDPVTICNMALGLLGDLTKVKRMTTMTRAGLTHDIHHVALDFYEPSKIEMHAMMDWARTRKVAALTVSADDPVLDGKWTYKYVRPPGAILFRKVIDTSGIKYEFDEVNEVASDGTNAEYIYTNVADAIGWWTILIGEERYMPGMDTLHSMILAQKLAMTVTAKPAVRFEFMEELRKNMRDFCMALGSREGWVENEDGDDKKTLVECF